MLTDVLPWLEYRWTFDFPTGMFRAVLAPLTRSDAARLAHHPRLERPIRLVDLCCFAAEHDDHYLAVIEAMLTR